MKKNIILLTALLMLTACTKENVTNDADTSTNIVTTGAVTTDADAPTDTTTLAADKSPDFRNVNWGMSKDQVITLEGTPSSENPYGAPGEDRYRLIYNVSLLDYSAELSYHFENDALTSAEYEFDCNDKTDLQIHTMYFAIRDEYISKYGSSDNSNYLTFNQDYQNISENPYISDPKFNFDETAIYRDDWNNANGTKISISMTYSNSSEDDKSIRFVISHIAINNP